MGINGLFSFLRSRAPSGFQRCHLGEALKDKVVAVDGFNMMHRKAIGLGGDWLPGFVTDVRCLMNNGIEPVYVIDGTPPELKARTIEARRARRLRQEALGKRPYVRIGDEDIGKLRRWCDRFGIRHVQAEGEADALMAAMVRDGHCAAAWSEDSDLVAYGAPTVVRSCSARWPEKAWDSRTGPLIEVVDLAKIRCHLKWSEHDLAMFCVMLGNDFNRRCCDPSTAYARIAQGDWEIRGERQKAALKLFTSYVTAEALGEPARFRGAGDLRRALKAEVGHWPYVRRASVVNAALRSNSIIEQGKESIRRKKRAS